MNDLSETVTEDRDFEILRRMEEAFDNRDASQMGSVLRERRSLFLRIHAVCMLADVGGEESVQILAQVLRSDPSPLVRHEAAFALGQLCYKFGVPALIEAMRNDPSVLVRHESAVALGSIGASAATDALEETVKDPDPDVSNSARIALRYLDYLARNPATTHLWNKKMSP